MNCTKVLIVIVGVVSLFSNSFPDAESVLKVARDECFTISKCFILYSNHRANITSLRCLPFHPNPTSRIHQNQTQNCNVFPTLFFLLRFDNSMIALTVLSVREKNCETHKARQTIESRRERRSINKVVSGDAVWDERELS